MPYFVVNAGSHTEDGVTYRKGDTFRSEKELDKSRGYVNKFTRANPAEIREFKKREIRAEEERARAAEEDQQLETRVSEALKAGMDDEVIEEKVSAKVSDKAKKAAKAQQVKPSKVESELGENVTNEFDEAKNLGVAVLKHGKRYSVAHAETPDEAVDGGDDLTKTETREFLEQMAEQREKEIAEAEEEEPEAEEDE